MSREPSSERLEFYTRMLQAGGEPKAKLSVNPILSREAPYFQLITLLHGMLRPVAPDTAFKAELREQLIAMAQREINRQQLIVGDAPKRSRLPWIAASAVLGATATLAGAYAVWRWNASRQVA